MFISRWMDKKAVVHIHSRILLSYEKECIWVSSNEMDETEAYYTEWSKSERETPIQYSNTQIYMEFRKMVTRILYARQQKRHTFFTVHCSAVTIARTLKQPRCWSADEWLRKLWYIYTMEHYSAKNNAFESVLMRWMKLEPIIQSEVSQKEKHQYSILTYIWNLERR